MAKQDGEAKEPKNPIPLEIQTIPNATSIIMDNDMIPKLYRLISGMDVLKKKATNPFFGSKYIDLNSLMEQIEEDLKREGLVIFAVPIESFHPGILRLQTVIMDEEGNRFAAIASMPLAKMDPQAWGSAVTYLRRYAIGSMLGMLAEADDDGNKATRPEETSEEKSLKASIVAEIDAIYAKDVSRGTLDEMLAKKGTQRTGVSLTGFQNILAILKKKYPDEVSEAKQD